MESEQGDGKECGGGVMVEIIVTENGNVRGVFTRVISASLTDSLNGECTFQFSVISSAAKEIFTGLEVELKSDTLNYLFNVVKVSKSLSNGIAICTVECEHKSYELNNDEYKLTEFDFEGAPGECLISLLQGTSLTAGICDPTVPIKLKINRECTRRLNAAYRFMRRRNRVQRNGNKYPFSQRFAGLYQHYGRKKCVRFDYGNRQPLRYYKLWSDTLQERQFLGRR